MFSIKFVTSKKEKIQSSLYKFHNNFIAVDKAKGSATPRVSQVTYATQSDGGGGLCLGGVINKKLSAYVSCMRSGVAWSQGPHTRRVAHCMRVCSTTRRLDCASLCSGLAWSSLASESCLSSLALPLSYFPPYLAPVPGATKLAHRFLLIMCIAVSQRA